MRRKKHLKTTGIKKRIFAYGLSTVMMLSGLTPVSLMGVFGTPAIVYAEEGDVAINEDTFPDEVFRGYVLENFDTDGDEVLGISELEAVTEISVENMGIELLQGIEHFANLSSLFCGDNQLSSLDVSENTALRWLSCSSNVISSLNIENNIELRHLECSHNQLSELDVHNNTKLQSIECYNNKLSSLDVRSNIALEKLDCMNNHLVTLNLSENTELSYLYCAYNSLFALDLSSNEKIEDAMFGVNQSMSFELSELPLDLATIDGVDISKITWVEGAPINAGVIDTTSEYDYTTYDYDCGNEKTMRVTLQWTYDGSETFITLDSTSLTMTAGEQQELGYQVAPIPDSNYDRNVIWTSSDYSVACVNANISNGKPCGKIVAKKAGTVTITCTANDGSNVSASCEVTVEAGDEEILPLSEYADQAIQLEENIESTCDFEKEAITALVNDVADGIYGGYIAEDGSKEAAVDQYVDRGILYRLTLPSHSMTYISSDSQLFIYEDLTSIHLFRTYGSFYGSVGLFNTSSTDKTYYLWKRSDASIKYTTPQTISDTTSTQGEVRSDSPILQLGVTQIGDATPYYSETTYYVHVDGVSKKVGYSTIYSHFFYRILVPARTTYTLLPGEVDKDSGAFGIETVRGIIYGYLTKAGDDATSGYLGEKDGVGGTYKYNDTYDGVVPLELKNDTDQDEVYYYESDSTGIKSLVLLDGSPVTVTGITLDETATVTSGNIITLNASVVPSYATNQNVTWDSSAPSIASVDENGVVTGHSQGTTIITCTSEEDETIQATCTVTVMSKLADYQDQAIVLTADKKYTCDPEEDVITTTWKDIDLSSYNWDSETAASYYNTTEYHGDGMLISLDLPAHSKTVFSIYDDPSAHDIYVYDDLSAIPVYIGNSGYSLNNDLTYAYTTRTIVNPSSTEKTYYIWLTNPSAIQIEYNEPVAVSDTDITFEQLKEQAQELAMGINEINASSSYISYIEYRYLDGNEKKTVRRDTYITNDAVLYRITVAPGDTYQILPGDLGNNIMYFDDTYGSYATVWDSNMRNHIAYAVMNQEGIRKFIDTNGEDYILENDTNEAKTYYVYTGKEYLDSIILTDGSPILITDLALSRSSVTMNIDTSITLSATITPFYATDLGITWRSSDSSIATVDDQGKVTAKSVGTATITCTSTSNAEVSASCEITVEDLEAKKISEYADQTIALTADVEAVYDLDQDTIYASRTIPDYDTPVEGEHADEEGYYNTQRVAEYGILCSLELPAYSKTIVEAEGSSDASSKLFVYDDLDGVNINREWYYLSNYVVEIPVQNATSESHTYYIWISAPTDAVSVKYQSPQTISNTQDTPHEAISKLPKIGLGLNTVTSDMVQPAHGSRTTYYLIDGTWKAHVYEEELQEHGVRLIVPAHTEYQVLPERINENYVNDGWSYGFGENEEFAVISKLEDDTNSFSFDYHLIVDGSGNKRCVRILDRETFECEDVTLKNDSDVDEVYYIQFDYFDFVDRGHVVPLESILVKSLKADIPVVDPSVTVSETEIGADIEKDELIENIDDNLSPTDQEKVNQAVEDGEALTYRMEIEKIEESAITPEQEAEQNAIKLYATQELSENYVIDSYFDISLGIFKQADTDLEPELLVEVTETKAEIPLVIALPQRLKRTGRVFSVLRFHDDEVDLLPVTQNEDGTLSFSSDKFSTYALTYVDPEYTVTITNGTANPTTAKTGDAITITAAGYPNATFKGWESSTEGVSFADASQPTTTFAMPSSNVTVNAKYEVQVAFNANGHGTAPDEQTITYNSKAIKPGMVKAENYEFVGWYKDQACTQAFDFNTDVTENTTLYASWKACSHSYGAWNITKQATTSGTGLKVHTCTKCGHSESEVIPKVVVTVTGITLNKTSASVDIGKTVVLSASVVPSNASNKNVTWKSSNDSLATVSNSGTVTGKKAGTVTITCTAADGSGKKATCTVTVVNPVIYVSGVSLNKTSTTIAKGSSETLTASIAPSNATNRGVTWSSTNPSVASVNSSGVITALAKGTATIVCTAADGSAKTAVCSITVTDYSPTEAFAARLYEKCLGRNPDLEGLEHWSGLLDRKQRSGAQVAYGFVFSEEYKAKNTTNEEYVDMLYRVFMDREADAGGREHWVNYLNNGMSRGYVFRGFVHSTEYTGICNNYGIVRGEVKLTQARDQNPRLTAYVNRMYTKALGRPGEEDGLNHWCKTIQTKTKTPEQVAESFINSTEFKNKNLSDEDYIKVLYRTFMGREYDEGGLAHWKEELKRGCSREEILHRFATSKEFKNIQADFGL